MIVGTDYRKIFTLWLDCCKRIDPLLDWNPIKREGLNKDIKNWQFRTMMN
jgi:hypothetical protein